MKRQRLIGVDCGATHSKFNFWSEGRLSESKELSGLNLDLVSGDEGENFFAPLGDLDKYADSFWIVGMAGLDNAREVNEADRWFREMLSAKSVSYQGLMVVSDIELVLRAGSPGGIGIGLIAGTGSNCLGRSRYGKVKKVGGMSHLLSDEGSGFALGWKCLHLMTKMVDGRVEKTRLLDDVFKLYEATDIVDLKNKLLKIKNQKTMIAKAAPLLIEAAGRGEEFASRIMAEESLELVRMVATVNEFLLEEILPVYIAGSLFKNIDFRDQFILNLHKYFPAQKVTIVFPIEGAISLYNSISEKTI